MSNSVLGKWLIRLGAVIGFTSLGIGAYYYGQWGRTHCDYSIESQISQKYSKLEKDLQQIPPKFTTPEAQENHQQAITLELKALEPDYKNAKEKLKERDEKLNSYRSAVTKVVWGMGMNVAIPLFLIGIALSANYKRETEEST